MKKTEWDDSNWREEYLSMVSTDSMREKLLKEGAKSLSQSWLLQAMHGDWMKMKGYSYTEPPDCSSSLQEWEKSIKNIKRS